MLLNTPSKFTGFSLTGTLTVGYCWKWTSGYYILGSITPPVPSTRLRSSWLISLPSKTSSCMSRLITTMR